MDALYFRLLMGHLVGDYLLASQTMQTKKGQQNTLSGWGWCMLHCLLYTLALAVCLGKWSAVDLLLIFNTHFWIDKFSLADKWARLTGGRTFEAAANEPDEAKRPFSIAFACLVYAVSDNTMHLLLLWFVS